MKRWHGITLFAGFARFAGFAALVSAATVLLSWGCGSSRDGYDGASSSGGSNGTLGSGAEAAPGCVGIQCQQTTCANGQKTTVSGKVFAPNGKTPLYNAIVYVPNTPVAPLSAGATCDRCGVVSGNPVVSTLSDATGAFQLENVPVGKSIPLVIQIGKWRREVVLPEVRDCVENPVDDPNLTRLPKNQSEGHIPQIALTLGQCDNLGCLLPKIGLDASEFGTEADGPAKAVHVYGADAAGGIPALQAFWTDASKLKKYDMMILSCECSESPLSKNGTPANPNQGGAFTAMTDYLAAGGRIFTSDYGYAWFRYTPNAELKSAANIRGGAVDDQGRAIKIDTSFPKGKALSDWLAAAAGISGGVVDTNRLFTNVVSNDPAKSQRWATSVATPAEPRVFTVNTPVGVPADQQCGKAVYLDTHVNITDPIDGASYPAVCTNPLLQAEHLLAFLFFDLASCIQNDNTQPVPPPVRVK